MRWLADENVQELPITALHSAGEEVVTVAALAVSSPDDDVVRLAAAEHRLLLTNDKDFGDLVVRQQMAVPGVVVLRLHGLPLSERAAILTAAVAAHGHRFEGSFTVIQRDRIRIRPLHEVNGRGT